MATELAAAFSIGACGPTAPVDICDALRSPKAGLPIELQGIVVKTRGKELIFTPSCSVNHSLDLPLSWTAHARIDAPVQDSAAAVVSAGDGVVIGRLMRRPTSPGWVLEATEFRKAVYRK